MALVVYHHGQAILIAPSSESLLVLLRGPLSGRVSLHGETRAAMESTLEWVPMVAAMSGTAMEANHHCLWSFG